jgi:glycosyltransferase involved in cell wall biosynthesis
LEEAGCKPVRVDLSVAFNQIDLPSDDRLTRMPDAPAGTLILHANGPEVAPALHALQHYGAKRWRIVGCWVWELEAAPTEWAAAARLLSEIWVPSQFCAHAFVALAGIPVRVVPYRITPPDLAPERKAPLYALTMADGRSSLRRKNPQGAIRVFLDALGDREDWSLIVKTRNLEDAPQAAARLRATARDHPRIRFLDASMTDAERWKLIADASVLISLHRSEGFGLPVAEALAVGVPVIATGWSAVAEFTPAEYLIPYALENVQDEGGPYGAYPESRWAEPDEAAASVLLRRIANAGAPSPRPAVISDAQSYPEALRAPR